MCVHVCGVSVWFYEVCNPAIAVQDVRIARYRENPISYVAIHRCYCRSKVGKL